MHQNAGRLEYAKSIAKLYQSMIPADDCLRRGTRLVRDAELGCNFVRALSGREGPHSFDCELPGCTQGRLACTAASGQGEVPGGGLG